MIRYEEGSELELYRCTENYWTIGIGFLIPREDCSRERAIKILDSKIGRVTGGRITRSEESMLFDIILKFIAGLNTARLRAYMEGLMMLDRWR